MAIPYVPTAGDAEYVELTAENAAAKNADIRDGTPTSLLSTVGAAVSALANGRSPTLRPAGEVTWQRWDTASMAYPTVLTDWATAQDNHIYDEEQLNIGFTDAYLAPAGASHWRIAGMLEHLQATGKTVACYYQTVRAALLTWLSNLYDPPGTGSGEEEILSTTNVQCTRRYWYWGTSNLPSPANGDADDIGIKAVLMELAQVLAYDYPVSALMLDSEIWAAFYDEGASGIFQALATELSKTNPVSLFPASSGDQYTSVVVNDNAALLDYRWHYARRNLNYRHAMARQILQSVWANTPVYTDNAHDHFGSFEDLDRISHWTFISWGKSLPIDPLVDAQIAQAHKRLESSSAKVWVAPELGRIDIAYGGTTYPTPSSKHEIGTGMASAIAGGANGFSLWGHTTVYSASDTYYTRSYDGNVIASGEWVMEVLKRYRALTKRQEALISSWSPTAARMAILYSQTDYQYEGGRGSSSNTLCYSTSGTIPETAEQSWQSMEAARNLHRAALLTGEPVAVVTTEDLETTGLSAYDALLVPSAYVLTQAEYDAIEAFYSPEPGTGTVGGGDVLAHVGSCLTPIDPILLNGTYHAYWNGYELAPPYNGYTAMTCTAMWSFLRALATDILAKLSFSPRFTVRNHSAIVTELTSGGTRYCVIVPAKFKAGVVDTWWQSVSSLSKFCERGLPGRVKLNEASQDIESGRSYAADDWITVGPGQIRIVEMTEGT